MNCYHCQSEQTNKAGFTKNRKQRFYCRACRRFFRANPVVPQGKKKFIQTDALPSKSRLILQLRSLTQELGKTPTTADLNKFAKEGRAEKLAVYFAVFGSFQTALKEANLRSRYKQEFNREKLLDELRALRQRLGRALVARDVAQARKRGEVSLLYHFQRAFGSVPQAIAAAGAARPEIEPDDIKVYLRKLARELGRVPTGRDISQRFVAGETPSRKEILKIFGSLTKARAAAGISYRGANLVSTPHWRKYTPDELLEQLTALARKLGRKPTDRDISAASRRGECAAATTFANIFGSLPNAYRKIGYSNIKPKEYSDREIMKALREMKRELGRMPFYNELKEASKAGRCPSPGTIRRRIGKLSEIKL